MPDKCSEAGRDLSAYIDGALDQKARAAIETHIAECSACASELKFMSEVDADINRLPAIEPSPFFSARVIAVARSMNSNYNSLRRFLRLPVPAMAIMVCFIMVNLFTFAFNINAMENGQRRELARKVVSQLAKPASLINPVAVARLCGECSKYMCLCMHEAGKQSLCPCKDCEMKKQPGQGNPGAMEDMEKKDVH